MKKYTLLLPLLCLIICCHSQVSKETDPNTISLTTETGSVFKLISVGDKIPQLFCDGRELSRAEMEKHGDILDRLQRALQERQTKEHSNNESLKAAKMKALVDQLIADKILESATSLYSLQLDPGHFIVNNKEQSWNAFEKYKKQFQISPSGYYHFNLK